MYGEGDLIFMGRSGDIGWGISNYFGLPNRKRNLLTKEFLQTFKEELITIFFKNGKGDNSNIDYENKTYYGFYGNVTSSYVFYEALKIACQKHNISKAIYEYAKKMPWYDSDYFNDDLVLEMVNKGVIKKDRPEDYISDYNEENFCKATYKIVGQHKGYSVIKYGNCFDEHRKSLEDIYKDGDWKLIWLN
jgi:hypothetical protein